MITNIAQTPDELLASSTNYQEQQITMPLLYEIFLPTKFHFCPTDNRYPVIEVMVYNVMYYTKNPEQLPLLLYYGQILTPPSSVDVSYQIEWKNYIELKMLGHAISNHHSKQHQETS
jgi:hypothetical protein